MNKRSQRGAARVSAAWMIVVIVLFFVALGFGFVSNDAATIAKGQAATARADAAEASDKYDAELRKTLALSKVLGFYDRAVTGALSDPSIAGTGLDSLRAVITMPESVKDYEQAIQPIIDALRKKDGELANLKTQLTNTEGRLSAAENANRSISSDLEGKISKASQDYSDLEQQAGDEKARLENDIAQLRSTVNQLNADLVAAKGETDDVTALAAQNASAATTRAAALNRQLKVLREEAGPDGEILAVSRNLMTGWINRGAASRVSRGMVFEVRTGNPNPSTLGQTKGWAQVTEVEENRAKVRIYNEADPYDPVGSRDKIYNPIFDPNGERYAVMVGRFSGAYNGSEVRSLLESVGITVQDSLDLTTNYLIVGGPLFVDADGEPSEEPIQPSELAEYQNAQAQGVYTISINDLRQYFRK